MIKMDIKKGKHLSFDVNIEGGNENEIKECRFIISCDNSNYKLMFDSKIDNNKINVDIPPIETNEKSGICYLEMISDDNQYYLVWESDVKFTNNFKINVKENYINNNIKASLNDTDDNNININENKNLNILNSNKITLYRTINCNKETLNDIISKNKFIMKPKKNLLVEFYDNNNQLLNDIELIEYGICIKIDVDENVINNKNNKIIVNSTYLDSINENNVIFFINNGRILNFE